MRNGKFDPQVLRDPSWWNWVLTVPLLAGHLAGIAGSLAVAMILCGLMAAYYWLRVRSVHAMPVQVRLVYLALLAIGTLPGMFWIHWVQLVGTSAMVIVGYCPLVRMLTLLPWNRLEPITRPWLWTLAVAPAGGGLWNFASAAAPRAACSCSVKFPDKSNPLAGECG